MDFLKISEFKQSPWLAKKLSQLRQVEKRLERTPFNSRQRLTLFKEKYRLRREALSMGWRD